MTRWTKMRKSLAATLFLANLFLSGVGEGAPFSYSPHQRGLFIVSSRSSGSGGGSGPLRLNEDSSSTDLENDNLTTIIANKGANITLNCEGITTHQSIAWIQLNKKVRLSDRIRVHQSGDGRLIIDLLEKTDQGYYTCQDVESNQSIHTIWLKVRSSPQAVSNLTVITHSVFALITWNTPEIMDDDSDVVIPIQNYVLSYRLQDESLIKRVHYSTDDENERNDAPSWIVINDIAGNENSKTVYNLVPNSTYYFRIYAVNQVGNGKQISVMAETKNDLSEIHQAAIENKTNSQSQNNVISLQKKEKASYVKIWIVGLSLFLVTFTTIGLGISLLLVRNCGGRSRNEVSVETTEEEAMELVPHITLNPSFNIDMLEYIEPEDSSSAHDNAFSVIKENANLVNVNPLPNG